MAHCTKCGAYVEDGDVFCGECGSKLKAEKQDKKEQTYKRKIKYEGEIHKCPNCGGTVNAFVKNCPDCGYELRGIECSDSVRAFYNLYTSANDNNEKIDLIRTFTIPNTKEDIWEFVILASSNIDTTIYNMEEIVVAGEASSQEVTGAWMAKLEQAYQKATILITDSDELKKIETIFNEKKKGIEITQDSIEKREDIKRRREWRPILIYGLFIVGMFLVCSIFALIYENGEKKNREKFQTAVEQIESQIEQGDYENALTKSYILDCGDDDELEKTKNTLIDRIYELQRIENGYIQVPGYDFEGMNYIDVVNHFKEAGFTNIKTEKVSDLVTGWVTKDGEVIDVTVDGKTTFEKNDSFSPGCLVVVRYHGF